MFTVVERYPLDNYLHMCKLIIPEIMSLLSSFLVIHLAFIKQVQGIALKSIISFRVHYPKKAPRVHYPKKPHCIMM